MINMFDYFLLTILLVSVLLGFLRGLIRELFVFFASALTLGFSLYFTPVVYDVIFSFLHRPELRLISSFLSIVLLVGLISGWAAHMLGRAAQNGELTFTQRLAGAGFGLLNAFMRITVILLALYFLHYQESSWWKHSWLTQYAVKVADTLQKSADFTIGHYASLSEAEPT